MSVAIEAGLCEVLAATRAWSATLGLRPAPLPGELARMDGELRGAPLRLETRREQGGPFASLTCATICGADGGLCSVTVIGMPADGSGGPVLGVDLIGLAGALSLVAVDLAPIDDPRWEERAAAPLVELHAAIGDGVVARRVPSFAQGVFSPRALIVGAQRGAEAPLLAAVRDFIARLPEVYAEGPMLAPARAAAARERVAAWCRAELCNRREHDALARIFGAGPAAAYLEQLFTAPG